MSHQDQLPRLKRTLRQLGLLALCLGCSLAAQADLVVVVNARSGVESLSREEVVNIFLGRYTAFPNGLTAQAYDYVDSELERPHFYQLLVKKTPAEINAYWARTLFSGRAHPPRQVGGQADMVDKLTRERGGIGYLPRALVDGRLRIVFELEK